MCAPIHVHARTDTHTHTQSHMHIYTHAHTSTLSYTRAHTHTHTHTHTHITVYKLYLQELASHSQHTYLYTQVVLQALSSSSEDDGTAHNPHIAQWLSQQLLRHNLAKLEHVIASYLTT